MFSIEKIKKKTYWSVYGHCSMTPAHRHNRQDYELLAEPIAKETHVGSPIKLPAL